ncbi:MAG: 50S ribosomal protein L29 [Candidatus Omnitrophota bacterium]|jgi:large subunit ribosomal protein L29|nr:50S ribosomal protein L29 [Candidatus Omnitrophota bacterium]
MKITEFQQMSSEDLVTKQKSFKKELSELSYQKKMSRVEKPHRFKLLKRDIARILTLLKQRDTKE